MGAAQPAIAEGADGLRIKTVEAAYSSDAVGFIHDS
jgi:hypothetical protein